MGPEAHWGLGWERGFLEGQGKVVEVGSMGGAGGAIQSGGMSIFLIGNFLNNFLQVGLKLICVALFK